MRRFLRRTFDALALGGNLVAIFIRNTPASASDNTIQPAGDFVPLTIKGVAGQTANLTEWQNSAGVVLSNVSASGQVTAPSGAFTSQLSAGIAAFSGVIGGDSAGSGNALQMKSATVTPPSNADYTLTANEMSCMLLTVVAGSWLAGHNIIVPNAAGSFWHFSNSSGFAMVVKTAAGTGITIANGRAAFIRSNGSNCRRMTPDIDPTV